MQYEAEVRIGLKPGVADPEGANTKKTLALLGFGGVRDVRATRAFRITVEAASEADARRDVEEMCRRLLVNPVIHTANIELMPSATPATATNAATTRTA